LRATPDNPVSREYEAPLLIDPRTDQARLISFEKMDEGCDATPAGDIDAAEKSRAEATIAILGLNRLPRLNQKRGEIWDACMKEIQNYKTATNKPHALKVLTQSEAIMRLREMIQYKKEFSSVVEACIHKMAPSPVRKLVGEHFVENGGN
jgi:hypothetical protein